MREWSHQSIIRASPDRSGKKRDIVERTCAACARDGTQEPKRDTRENNVTAFDPFRAHPPNTQSCRCPTRPSSIVSFIRFDRPTIVLVSSWRHIAAPNLKNEGLHNNTTRNFPSPTQLSFQAFQNFILKKLSQRIGIIVGKGIGYHARALKLYTRNRCLNLKVKESSSIRSPSS